MGSAPAPGAVFRALAENIGRTEKFQVSRTVRTPHGWIRGRIQPRLEPSQNSLTSCEEIFRTKTVTTCDRISPRGRDVWENPNKLDEPSLMFRTTRCFRQERWGWHACDMSFPPNSEIGNLFPMRTLEKLTIKNFKSICDQTVELRPLTAFIGANGSGKSNLISVFPFVRRLVEKELQLYTGVSGGANRVLHFGRKRSPSMSMEMEFGEADMVKGYRFVLVPTEEDRFVFGDEAYWVREREQYSQTPPVKSLGAGHKESKIGTSEGDAVKHVVNDLLSYRLYHFHDTSSSAGLKQTSEITDNHALKSNGSNLASFLYLLKQTSPENLRTIEENVRQVA